MGEAATNSMEPWLKLASKHFLIFSSGNGNRYLFDAATASVHHWPCQARTESVDEIYNADDCELPGLLLEMGAPVWLSDYIKTWRLHAGAFRGPRKTPACSGTTLCGSDGTTACAADRPPAWKPSPAVLSNLMLIVTEACNLRCDYCVFSGSYKEFRPHGNSMMSFDTARKGVDRFFELNESPPFKAMPNRKLDISFFGGEPLLNAELIRQVVPYAKARKAKHYMLQCSATTNLTYLPDDLARFFVENSFSLLVSLDGPEAVHDRFRRNAAGVGSYQIVMRNLEKLRKLSPQYVDDHVRIVVTLNAHSDLRAIHEFFDGGARSDLRVEFVGWIRDSDCGGFYGTHPYDGDSFRRQYRSMVELYLSYRRTGRKVTRDQFLYHMIEEPLLPVFERVMRSGSVPKSGYTGACQPGKRIAVAVDGTFHLCERINQKFPIGNVESGLDLDKCADVYDRYFKALPECGECWARSACTVCFAQVAEDREFVFGSKKCDIARTGLGIALATIYTLREEVPGALISADPMIDSQALLRAG